MTRAKPSLSNVRALRDTLGMNQSAFWSKFGVTQSGGSRYESGRSIPTPLKILLQAWLDKVVDDATLAKLSDKIKKAG
jgi:DNA-binding transcriptional regulator YiaG